MNECTAGFEVGTATSNILVADTGNATAWDSINLNGDGVATYDTTHAIRTQAAKLSAGSIGGPVLTWTTALGAPLTDYYWRMYVYLEDLPGGTGLFIPVNVKDSGSDTCWRIDISSAGVIILRDAAGGAVHTFSASMPTDQWVRFEGHTVHSGGSLEVKLYLTADSTSPDETTSTSGNALRASADTCSWGIGALSSTAWLDELVMGATAYPGPVVAAKQTLRPSADSVDGSWTDQAGGTSLAAAIDETTPSDTDYIRSPLSPSAAGCRVKLAAGGDPLSSSGHIIHWRAGKDATGDETINMTVKLYQGGGDSLGAGTLIASFNRNNVDAFTTYDETLSGGEADSITDYQALYLEFFATVA